MRRMLDNVFALDVRSLAVLRIGLALMILWDIAVRYPDLTAHYSDHGVLAIAELPVHEQMPSLHIVSGSILWQAFLFYVQGFLALALLVGWRTRWVTVLSWAMLLSLHGRNGLVLHGGDAVLRVLLFWSMFLPLGACWSFDARDRPPPPRRVTSMASAAFLIQLVLLYVFAALGKWGPAWRSDGSAVFMALSVGHTVTRIGQTLLAYPDLMRFLTFATLVQEGVVPLLLFVPWRTWLFRLVVIGSFIAFHVGLILCLELGNFEQVCIVGWLALLPTELWDWIVARFPARDAKPHSAPTLSPLVTPLHPALNAALAFLIGYVVVWNVSTWNEPPAEGNNAVWSAILTARDAVRSRFPVQNAAPGAIFGLEQGWAYFGPEPSSVHGWLVATGTLADGREVDLLAFALHDRVEATNWERPAMISETYPNWRWRSYLMRLSLLSPPAPPRHFFAVYLRNLWNAAHPDANDQLRFVDLYAMRERTLKDGPPPDPVRVRLCRLDCATTVSDLNETGGKPDDRGGQADQIVP